MWTLWIHTARGPIPTHLLVASGTQVTPLPQCHPLQKEDSNRNHPARFLRKPNGTMCVECLAQGLVASKRSTNLESHRLVVINANFS